MEHIEDLLRIVQQCVVADAQIKREKFRRGENFNIFNTLGLRSNEVRLHSAFLAELLNPCGSHGMGGEFLSAFLGVVGLPTDYINASKVDVNHIVERNIGFKTESSGGRIDIILEDRCNAIIIENKIYAADQENQLLRYFNYGKEKFGRDHFCLFYLTLDGHEPAETSVKEGVKYKCISYGNEILKWLDQCVRLAFNMPLIRETINQYINLIKQLTNKDMDTKQQSEMFEAMAKYPEAVAAIFNNGFHSFRDYLFRNKVFPRFQEIARTRFNGLLFNEENLLSDEKEICYSFCMPQWQHLKIYVDSEDRGACCYIGIAFANSDDALIKDYQHVQLECLPDKPFEIWPYGSKFLKKYASIKDSEILPALLDTSDDGYCAYIMSEVKMILDELKHKQIELE